MHLHQAWISVRLKRVIIQKTTQFHHKAFISPQSIIKVGHMFKFVLHVCTIYDIQSTQEM